MSVRSIIGLPTLRQWNCHIEVCGNCMVCPFLISIFPLFFERTKPGLTSGITLSASQFQRPPLTQTINNPINHLIAITDSSYDHLQLPPTRDACHNHSIPRTEGPLLLPLKNLKSHSLIIELPQNIYRLKVQNKYIYLDYGIKIDGGG